MNILKIPSTPVCVAHPEQPLVAVTGVMCTHHVGALAAVSKIPTQGAPGEGTATEASPHAASTAARPEATATQDTGCFRVRKTSVNELKAWRTAVEEINRRLATASPVYPPCPVEKPPSSSR